MLGLEPFYLDRKGEFFGNSFHQHILVLALGHGFLSVDVISYKERGDNHSIYYSCADLESRSGAGGLLLAFFPFRQNKCGGV